jgi:hypothetical protein
MRRCLHLYTVLRMYSWTHLDKWKYGTMQKKRME